MSLKVDYSGIRSDIISKLMSQGEEMADNLNRLDRTVDSLPEVMEAKSLDAYINEYHIIVQRIYQTLNENLIVFAQELEDKCGSFETLDKDINGILNANV